MKGIVLAGGTGSRLRPLTFAVSKQLLPIHDKPLIYYSISTLFLAGIRDIAIICTPRDKYAFINLLGDGRTLGVNFTFLEQPVPKGIGQAFGIAEYFIGESNVALILGDNIFHGTGFGRDLSRFVEERDATILAYQVSNPSEFGVVEIDENGKPLQIVEKPKEFISDLAVPGLYFYGNHVVEKSKKILPSHRGEIEITSINQEYLVEKKLKVERIPRGVSWFDGGTIESLHEASEYVRVLEKRQGLKIGCLEEIAWRNGWITSSDLKSLGDSYFGSEYGEYLIRLSQGEYV